MNRTKGLARMSPKRRDALAAVGITHPPNTFASPDKPATPAKRNGNKQGGTGPDDATVKLVLKRDHWRCVVCGDELWGRRGFEWSIHHRVLRSQGVDNRPPNLISVCGHGTSQCHGDLHRRPAAARETGRWMLRSTDDPLLSPVLHSQHGWVLLDDKGGHNRTEPPHDPLVAAMPAGREF